MPTEADQPKQPRPKRQVPAPKEAVAVLDISALPLAVKIAKITGEIKPINRSAFNEYYGFTFAPLESVKKETSPLLAKYGVAIVPSVKDYKRDGQKTILELEYTITDGKESFTVGWRSEGNDKGDYGITKALSFATKYFLINLFNIPIVDEADGDSGATSETPLLPLHNQMVAQYRSLHPKVMQNDEAILSVLYQKAGVKNDQPRTLEAAAKVFALLHAKAKTAQPDPVPTIRPTNPQLSPDYVEPETKYGVPESELDEYEG
jgi:hypothetical protein